MATQATYGAHAPQICIVVFRTKQLGLAVALPEVYPCTRPFLRVTCACGGSRACLRLGPAALGAFNAAGALRPFGLLVSWFLCSLVSLFLCLGLYSFPMASAFARRR